MGWLTHQIVAVVAYYSSCQLPPTQPLQQPSIITAIGFARPCTQGENIHGKLCSSSPQGYCFKYSLGIIARMLCTCQAEPHTAPLSLQTKIEAVCIASPSLSALESYLS